MSAADAAPASVDTPRRSRRRSTKAALLLALVIADLAALLGWSQRWFTLSIQPGAIGTGSVPLDGQTAAGAVAPLALSGIALVFALLLAGPVFRVVLGVLQALLGACVVAQAWIAMADPAASAVTTLVGLSGIADSRTVLALVRGSTQTGWPVFTLAVGVALLLLGAGISTTAASWPNPTSRHSRTRAVPVETSEAAHTGPQDSIAEWDALSAGDDPTDR